MFTTPEALWALPLFVGVLAISALVRSRRLRQVEAYSGEDSWSLQEHVWS